MRRHLIVGFFLLMSAQAFAQQQPAPAVPIEIKLSPEDQSDLRSVCVLAVRSPQVTESDAVLMIADFCVRIRNTIAEANAVVKAKIKDQPKPKE